MSSEVEGTPQVLLSPFGFVSNFYSAQCEEDALQQVREFKEFTRQVKVDEERMIHDIQVKYEKKLHTERETNASLKGESSVGIQKVACSSCSLPPHLPFSPPVSR